LLALVEPEKYRNPPDFTTPYGVIVLTAIVLQQSYLLSRMRRARKGFALGSTMQTETQGIWLWGSPIRVNGITVLYMDTEGLGDPGIGGRQVPRSTEVYLPDFIFTNLTKRVNV
jgi:hypothetical protein